MTCYLISLPSPVIGQEPFLVLLEISINEMNSPVSRQNQLLGSSVRSSCRAFKEDASFGTGDCQYRWYHCRRNWCPTGGVQQDEFRHDVPVPFGDCPC